MHSMLVTMLSIIILVLSTAGFGSSVATNAWLCASFVALIGVPHGSLDHETGRRLLRPFFKNHWWAVFFLSYIFVGVSVIAAWYISPVGICLLFLLLSAWHFGLEEDYQGLAGNFLNPAAIARGSCVIAIPALARPADVQAMFDVIIPEFAGSGAEIVVSTIRAAGAVLLPLALLDFCLFLRSASKQPARTKSLSGNLHYVYELNIVSQLSNVNRTLTRCGSRFRRGSKTISVACRVLSIVALCALVHPLLAFTVYFCFWHSLRGMSDLMRAEQTSSGRFLLRLMPISLTSIGLALVGFVFWSQGQTLSEGVIRTTFLFLSAIAIPHLLLNALYRIVDVEVDQESEDVSNVGKVHPSVLFLSDCPAAGPQGVGSRLGAGNRTRTYFGFHLRNVSGGVRSWS